MDAVGTTGPQAVAAQAAGGVPALVPGPFAYRVRAAMAALSRTQRHLGLSTLRVALRRPWLWGGLAVRCTLIALVLPDAVSSWYLPFLVSSTWTADPWSDFLSAGGTLRAFPYGAPMFLILRLGVLLAQVTHLPAHLGYGGAIVAADVAVMWSLAALRRAADEKLLALYWLSPISLLALYWLGFNDVIPILFIVLCLVALRGQRPRAGAVLAAIGVAAKLSMVVTLPFLLVFLVRNNKYRVWTRPFVSVFLATSAILAVPYLYSAGARAMLFQNPELWKALAFAIPWGNGLAIFILPLLYTVVLFGAWQIRRMSFDLLLAMLGLSFFLVLTLTPAPPGWFVWVLPFLVLHQWENGRRAQWLVLGYSAIYVSFQLVHAPLPRCALFPAGIAGQRLSDLVGLTATGTSLWQTALVGGGVIVAARMLRESIYRNEYFRLSRKPFVLSIAGDSGAGKDTLVDGLAGLLGSHSVARLSGDDYHLWDRQKPIWQVMTHVNPQSSHLDQLAEDIRSLTEGRTIRVPRYDHDSGRKTRPSQVTSNDFVLVSGLHVLYTPMLRERCELTVFLSMDEGLRRHFKVERDTRRRGYSREQVLASLAQRSDDSERYIAPQAQVADLALSLQPVDPRLLAPGASLANPRLKLVAWTRRGMHYRALLRVLVGLCGLHVEVDDRLSDAPLRITIEGEVGAEDIAAAARELIPRLDDLLDLCPRWLPGMSGVMQLVVLLHVAEALRRRLA